MMDTGQASKYEDLENFHKSSIPLARIKESLGMDIDDTSLEQLIKKNCW